MINIRKDLIQKELERDFNIGFSYNKFNLHNKFIDKLFNQYYCHEMCENWYDSEPETNDLVFEQYMDYEAYLKGKTNKLGQSCNLNGEWFWYADKQYPLDILKDSYDTINKAYKNYEQERIEFNNWQEPYFEGNWGQSQKSVDKTARNVLKYVKKLNISKKDRLYISHKDNQIRIYVYLRDYEKLDYWFIFVKKGTEIKC